MRNRLRLLGALVALSALAVALPSTAGPENIAFPGYKPMANTDYVFTCDNAVEFPKSKTP